MPTLTWIGKEAVEKHHLEIPYRLLEYDESLSAGDQESGNLIVQGDNLHALKALLPYYAGKVKCIYIDPPYNTGNEGWQYNDNVNSPEIKEWLQKTVGPEGEDLTRHDKWLCMMFPRLQLLKKLLSDDGAIFISIDDNSQALLKILLDEIFGSFNFVSNIIWQKKYSPQNDAKYLSDSHDFIVVYAKKKSIWQRNLLRRSAEQDNRYKNPDNDPRGPWKPADFSVRTYSSAYDYPITTPSGRVVLPPKGRCWTTSFENFEKMLADDRIYFGKEGNNIPALKKFLSEVKQGVVPVTIWSRDEVGDNQEGRQELKQLFPEANSPFESPKPTRLLKRIIELATNPNDVILDSFSGSGTLGQAVLELNKEDGGKRKFILIELEEKIAREVTSERLKRVIQGYKRNKKNEEILVSGAKSGFRFCKLSKPLFDKYGNVNEGVKFNELARHVFFSETGLPLPANANLISPHIGTHKGIAYYLLFNGILGDKSLDGGNVLTSKILESLPEFSGKKIIFGESCRLSDSRLQAANIVFKQIPYEIRTS